MSSNLKTLDETLPGDNDTPATLTLSDGQAISTNSPIDINIRGSVSRTFPKKSYKIEFVDNTASRESRDTSLLNLRDDSDWLLLAMYNEASRVNNVSAHALWLDMHQLYYAQQEPNARPGIRTRYIDAFLNGSYVGIYALTEAVDRKQLRLKKTRTNRQARGELHKASNWTAATLFTSLPQDPSNDSVWAGFELKYPKTPGFWDNMKGLVASVTNTSDSVFRMQAPVRWQLNNLADYFIFLNLTRATNNRGKNLYIARYQENEPYFIVPWDLDGTWGFI